ncbi:MAG: hypothetical protein NTY99_02605 [DPANN group archaeon]|nr:hypothetical protein [DPANN group archaeon]
MGKLRNLEYREAASQKWKKWETEVQNGIEDSLQKVIQAIHRENTNVSVLYIQSAIRELRKLTHYELRIGG